MWTKILKTFSGPTVVLATTAAVFGGSNNCSWTGEKDKKSGPDDNINKKKICNFPVAKAAERYIPPPPVPATKWDFNWDKRQPESLVKPKVLESQPDAESRKALLEKHTSKTARHIFLIRHGQYDISPELDEDQKLTKLGIEQARYTGKRLKEIGVKYDLLLNSSMTRAIQTADIIYDELSPEFVTKRDMDPMLIEGAPYPPEPTIPEWPVYARDFQVDGARIEAAFRKYFHRSEPSQQKDSVEIYVCHGNVIRYICCRALQLPPEGWLRFSVAHGSITWILIKPNGRVVLRALGDSGHIPAQLVTL